LAQVLGTTAQRHRVPVMGSVTGGCCSAAGHGSRAGSSSSVGCIQSGSSMGCMRSRRQARGVFHPSTGRGVFTEELDMQCNQATDMAMEISRQSATDDVSWAILESKRQALDDEIIAEALAWSYEHPSPRGSPTDRFKLDLSKIGSSGGSLAAGLKLDLSRTGFGGDINECWSPTLLTQRRALSAKLDRGNSAFNKAPHDFDIGEEALRLPVGMRSACLPGERGLPSKVSSIRSKRQQATVHTEAKHECWRSLFRVGTRTTITTKVAAVSRRYRPLSGKDWTPIIGPTRNLNLIRPKLQLPVREMSAGSGVGAYCVSDTSCAGATYNTAWENSDTLDRI